MRYDKVIYFCKTGQAAYNEETGDYEDPTTTVTKRFASVMDTNRETMHLVYGEIREGSMTIQIQNHYDDAFDHILIGGVKYAVDYSRRLRVKQTFIVSEVQ